MSVLSKTDLKRLRELSDNDINLDDIPELNDVFFNNAQLILHAKETMTMQIDTDVLLWFKQQGKGYQARINQLLRRYMETHQN